MIAWTIVVSLFVSAKPISSAEAERHFEQGLRHFSSGDREGALLEFEQARAIEPSPPVLFNIALIASTLGRHVHALEALELLLATPEKVPANRMAKVKALHAQSLAKVGTLVIRAPVEGAAIDVDGRSVGRAPLSAPVRVMPGRVLVTALAPRYAPGRQEIEVVPGQRRELEVPLQPLERPIAQLKIACEVPGADVYLDGQRVAMTPVKATIPVVPGDHVVRLAREGYRASEQRLELQEGSTAELGFTLEENPTDLVRASGRIEPHFSETQVLVTVDGQRRGTDVPTLLLPPGLHTLVFERSGFFPQRHDVSVAAGGVVGLPVSFEPTPELRAELDQRRGTHRGLGIAGFAVSGALVAAGAVSTAVLFDQKTQAQRSYDAAFARYQTIDCKLGGQLTQCESELANADARLVAARGSQWVGPTLMGAGGALFAASLITFLLAPDPARYDRQGADELAPSLAVSLGSGAGMVTARWAY